MGEGFGVADAGEGGEGSVVATVAEAASFVQEATFEHLLGAPGRFGLARISGSTSRPRT